ncbi:transmembrane protein 254-like [Ptychodera flava]|uniref:transmembrane protein 254-like n=1 Tax=Ptychodera flava TaxID=63121 RepID=UPI003969F97E
MTRSKTGRDYFVRTNAAAMVFVVLGLGFFTITVFKPEIIPYGSLGPFGNFVKNLVDNYPQALYKGYILALALHVGEGFLTQSICSSKGITDGTTRLKWFMQTLFFGIFSLYHLLVYNPKKTK